MGGIEIRGSTMNVHARAGIGCIGVDALRKALGKERARGVFTEWASLLAIQARLYALWREVSISEILEKFATETAPISIFGSESLVGGDPWTTDTSPCCPRC